MLVDSAAYKTYSQIAAWNNENAAVANATFAANFASLRQWCALAVAAVVAAAVAVVVAGCGPWGGL